jgi:NADH pyrophosphatase NudC (nudix superfamily)
MRLINADELKKKLEAEHCDCEIMAMIDNMPTAAEAVKHGRWIFKSRNKLINTGKLFVSSRVYTPKSLPASEFCEIPRGSYFFEKVHKTIQIPFCSRCGNRGGDNECDISKYCPECGARMDGDTND